MERQFAPIGVFDSGLGGLSVLQEIRTLLPAEDLLYVADGAYCPYGTRTPQEILERSLAIAGALVSRSVKLAVVACNTACSVALDDLRARFSIPIVGLEPAIKPAAVETRSGRIAVIATPRTVAGTRLRNLVELYGRNAEVRLVAAPGWVDLVESGQTRGLVARDAVESLVRPLLAAGVDTIVLGCTHYPFLRSEIEASAGSHVRVIDSGEAIARRTRDLLDQGEIRRNHGHDGVTSLFTTGDAVAMSAICSRLLGRNVVAEHFPV
ncbi:MAG: glutamate racemase [Thermomicrobiales bacterium]